MKYLSFNNQNFWLFWSFYKTLQIIIKLINSLVKNSGINISKLLLKISYKIINYKKINKYSKNIYTNTSIFIYL